MSESAGSVAPFFSVVMATHGRGRHILPSIVSVLRQDLPDFELLVVGDASTDETEAVVASVGDSRVRWLNITPRCGSQSGPNNAGIAAARGEVIAYLGHDDIWERDHLSRLAALYRSDCPPDFAVSGSIFHLPNGIPGSQVMGLFGEGEDISHYFFPPSSFSHRTSVTAAIGPWRMPMDCRAPVDEDFLLRALAVGMTFRSTGVVTLHKFAAGHRYLSYVRQESHEQDAMLGRGSAASGQFHGQGQPGLQPFRAGRTGAKECRAEGIAAGGAKVFGPGGPAAASARGSGAGLAPQPGPGVPSERGEPAAPTAGSGDR